MKRIVTALAAAALLAGCNETQNAVIAAFGSGLASVNCTTSTASANGIAQNIISISTNCPTGSTSTECQTAAADDAKAAAAANIAAELCPAFQGLGNVIVQASIASTPVTGTPTVNVAPAASTRGAELAVSGTVTSTNPWTFTIPVKASGS